MVYELKSRNHLVNIELVNGQILEHVPVRTSYETSSEATVLKAILNNPTIKHNKTNYLTDKFVNIYYVGMDIR